MIARLYIILLPALILTVYPDSVYAQKDLKTDSDKVSLPKQHSLLILPLVARSIETDWSFGIASSYTFHISRADSISRTSNVQALVLYSINRQFLAAINGATYFPGEKYILNEQISFSHFPDKFWGIGTTAPDSNEESYTFKQFYLYLHLQRLINNRFFLGLLYEFQDLLSIQYKPGGLFDIQNVAGRKGYIVSGLGLSFTWDNRNHAFTPEKGELLQISFNHFNNIFGSDYRYTNFILDLRKFISFYSHHVLALQGYGFLNWGKEIPLRSLASFGGSRDMRGYYDGRYRDKNQFIFQAEYRIPIYRRFGAVVFGDGGSVNNKPSDFRFSDLKYSYGIGLRFLLSRKEKLNLRLDYGIGEGTSRGFYFQLAEAF